MRSIASVRHFRSPQLITAIMMRYYCHGGLNFVRPFCGGWPASFCSAEINITGLEEGVINYNHTGMIGYLYRCREAGKAGAEAANLPLPRFATLLLQDLMMFPV